MFRRVSASVFASTLLIITVLLIGVSDVYASSTPSKAELPDLIYLSRVCNDIYFDYISVPKNAKSLEIWIRRAAYKKYVGTAKKGTSKYNKYRKSKKYVLKKKSGKTYNVYKKISAAKWVKIIDTNKSELRFTGRKYNGGTYRINASMPYQVRVRGKNGKKYGKYSGSFKFRSFSKDVLNEYGYMLEEKKASLKDHLDELETEKGKTTDPSKLAEIEKEIQDTQDEIDNPDRNLRTAYWLNIYDSGVIPYEDDGGEDYE